MIRPLDTITAVTLATRLRARDLAEVVCTEWHDDPAAWAASMAARPGEKFALLGEDGLPVAMGGFMPLWPGVVHTWLAASDELPRYGRELLRAVTDCHKGLAASGVRRFQSYCLAGYETGQRFMHHLGYAIEGQAKGFGKHGEDFDLLARIERATA